MKVLGIPAGLLLFTLVSTGLMILYCLATQDPREGLRCAILGGLALCIEVIMGLCGAFKHHGNQPAPTDGVDRRGQGRD